MAKTPDLDLYFLARNVRWRYQLDQYEDAALKELLGYYDGARKTLERRIESFAPDMKKGRFTRDRVEALLDEVYAVSGTIRKKIGEDVSTIAAAAGEASFKEHSDSLSLGGMLTPFNAVAVGAEQIKALLVKTPIGGRNLQGWIDKTFDDATRAGIKAEVAQGMILGEGYPALVKRLSTGFDIARREAITIARTYVQNVNVSAQEAGYKANKNIVKAVEWSSVLEPGYAKTGRGTCLRCAALDGRKWKIDEEHPQIPLHPRCRCVLLPVTKTWKELGVDLDELEDVERAATIVDDKNIDAGGRRTIREVGFHKGTYSTWFEGQSPRFQKNVLGRDATTSFRQARLPSTTSSTATATFA
jgi:SPP1 gp7 family putative phage head morphogenesis protein